MPNPRLACFLALSFLSGLFEIGVAVWGLAAAGSQTFLPFLLALAYQLGAFVGARPADRRVRGGLTVATAGMALATIVGGPGGLAWTFLLVVMVSALINLARAALGKAEISTTLKRSARVLGFLSAPALLIGWVPAASALLAVVLSAGAALLAAEPAEAQTSRGGTGLIIKSALVTHQMHYFSYSTVVVVMLLQHYAAGIAMLVFVLGWASYIAVPHLIGSRTDPGNAALWGHLLLPFVLLAMSVAAGAGPLWSLLWVATGFLGGTVLHLTRFARQRYGLDETQLTSLESIGHCLGAGLALAFVASGAPASGLFVVAAFLAALTAILIATCLHAMPRLLRSRM